MKQKSTKERGTAGFKALIALLILAAIVYTGIQLVPIYWDHWNFEDEVKTELRFLFVNVQAKREEYLNNFVIGKLKEMGAEYKKENVRVKVDDSKKKAKVEIWYTRTHKLPFFPNPKQFYINLENTTIE